MSADEPMVLGIDLGTSCFKALLVDRRGRLRGLGRATVATDGGEGGLCELPVQRFWDLLRQALAGALAEGSQPPSSIQGLSYSSQANSFILLDEGGEPLTPLILWPDHRAAGEIGEIEKLMGRGDFLATTGLGIDPCCELAAAKYGWFRRHQPELWSRAARVMTISDYLVWSLTGRAAGDEATTSLLGLWDLRNHRWWDDALKAVGLERSRLSAPLSPGGKIGGVGRRGAELLPLPVGAVMVAGSLDHHAAAIGAGLVGTPVSVSLGTVLACMQLTPGPLPKRGCSVGPGAMGDGFYRLAFMDEGASLLEWYQRNFAPELSIPELAKLAEQVASPDARYSVWEPQALVGVRERVGLEGFAGRRESHGHGHYVRALMRLVAENVSRLMGSLEGPDRLRTILCTGGGARNDFWLQMVADVTGLEVTASACPEPACLGAAMFAAVSCAWFGGLSDTARAWIQARRTFRPRPH